MVKVRQVRSDEQPDDSSKKPFSFGQSGGVEAICADKCVCVSDETH